MKLSFIDTHAHIYDKSFQKDIGETLLQCQSLGVEKIYLPNIDGFSIKPLLDLEAAYPKQCFAMMGLHPCSVKEDFDLELAVAGDWLEKRNFAGIGEAGLDLYWDKTFYAQQVEALEVQIGWAKKYRKPLILHTRNAIDETIKIVAKHKDKNLRGIFHCFGDGIKQAQAIIDLGFKLGIGGVVTFKNSGLDKVLPQVPLESLVLETDSPYLAPTPHRGKRNSPIYIPIIAERIAQIMQIPIAQVAEQTSLNALEVFGK
ncbi:MAG: TatD family hydrolase [Bernardetiaceae bacterium]|nr:TatD family hydrolase [Bernardetiaceae bacterium]